MKKLTIFFVLALVFSINTYSQVGIGTTTPQAQLDIRSSNQATPTNTDGILIPKVDTFPTGVNANQDAVLVYLTTTIGSDTPGFYYYNHTTTSWLSIGKGAKKIEDLLDGKSDSDGSSVFLGQGAGANDDSTDNQNTGIGFQTLNANTIGNRNTANGYRSLYSNTEGRYNVSNGSYALYSNTEGDYNVANGLNALYSNTTGRANVANGAYVLYSNTIGIANVANGSYALYSNTEGIYNVANGSSALYSNTEGDYNVANGSSALNSNTTGSWNTANGFGALYSNTIGSLNVANGYYALYHNTIGGFNTANGSFALYSNTEGRYNVANGDSVLYSNTLGNYNVGNGYQALHSNTEGTSNIANGRSALYSNTEGEYNVAIGSYALASNITGNYNVSLGYEAGFNETGSNKLYIENSRADETDALIYGEFDTDVLRFNGNLTISNANGTHTNATLFLNALGVADLGTNNLGLAGDIVPFAGSASGFDLGNNNATEHWDDVVADDFINFSDRRLKNSIKDMPYGLETVLKLNPVTYRYNKDFSIDNRFRLGLIAQEVEAIIPEVVFNEDIDANPETGEKIITKSDYKSMSYVELVPVLIKAIQEQQDEIEVLKSDLKRYKALEERIKALEQNN